MVRVGVVEKNRWAYNCVSRFLVALDVGECNGRAMKKVEELGQGH